MSTQQHVVVSHGADFFGEDRYAFKTLATLAAAVESCFSFPSEERRPLVTLLKDPSAAASIPPADAAGLADLLLRVSRHRHVKRAMSAVARALADAAGRAAADGEPWTWTVEQGTATHPLA